MDIQEIVRKVNVLINVQGLDGIIEVYAEIAIDRVQTICNTDKITKKMGNSIIVPLVCDMIVTNRQYVEKVKQLTEQEVTSITEFGRTVGYTTTQVQDVNTALESNIKTYEKQFQQFKRLGVLRGANYDT